MEFVLTDRIFATTKGESMPPDKNAPTGTSLLKWRFYRCCYRSIYCFYGFISPQRWFRILRENKETANITLSIRRNLHPHTWFELYACSLQGRNRPEYAPNANKITALPKIPQDENSRDVPAIYHTVNQRQCRYGTSNNTAV